MDCYVCKMLCRCKQKAINLQMTCKARLMHTWHSWYLNKKRSLEHFFISIILTLLFYRRTPLKITIFFFSHIPPQRFHSFWKTLHWTQTCLQLWEESLPDQASNTLIKLMLSCKPLIYHTITCFQHHIKCM